jgi:mono/diheme cytochrome c family protein
MMRALSPHTRPEVADLLLAAWDGYSPAVRREVVEVLFARADRLPRLLAAIEQKRVRSNQLEPLRVAQLRKHADPKLRAHALRVLAGQEAPERRKVVAAYRAALDLAADAARGKAVFKKNCAVCHRLDNEGVEVGPDLVAALRNK